MKFYRDPGHDDPEINLIPLIDVLLVILIFLTATTTFARIGALPVTLPSVATQTAAPSAEIALEITANGAYAINGEPVPTEAGALRAVFQRHARPDAPPMLIIYADAFAPHQVVIDAMQAARDAGITRVTFGTRTAAR